MKHLLAAIAVVCLVGLWTTQVSAQTSQRLLQALSIGLSDLDCTIAGPTIERLRRNDLLRSLEQGVEAIRSRHDEDDGVPPSLRVVGGRPRIEPGDRLTLRRGSRLIDEVWVGGRPGDTPIALVRDARNFLDAAIIDDEDDEPIAVLERAVLTQAFAYAVNSRIARLCGTILGAAVSTPERPDARAVAGTQQTERSTRSSRVEQVPGSGARTLGEQVRGRAPRDSRRRSMVRTVAGIGQAVSGGVLMADFADDLHTEDGTAWSSQVLGW